MRRLEQQKKRDLRVLGTKCLGHSHIYDVNNVIYILIILNILTWYQIHDSRWSKNGLAFIILSESVDFL